MEKTVTKGKAKAIWSIFDCGGLGDAEEEALYKSFHERFNYLHYMDLSNEEKEKLKKFEEYERCKWFAEVGQVK